MMLRLRHRIGHLLPRRMMSRESMHRHWTTANPDGGDPESLIRRGHRSAALVGLVSDLPRSTSIIEVGCGPGRNLAHLYDAGFHGLQGVEINPNAVDVLRREYPQLADVAIHVGPAEDILPTLEPVDLVVTLAVIEHIHPDSAVVFDEMARLGRMVLAVEPVAHRSSRQYPHDVPALFEARGFRLASMTRMADIPETADDPYMADYVAWRFVRPE